METITSRDNAKIKYACAVRDSEKQRAADGLFFAEGPKLCLELAKSCTPRTVYATAAALAKTPELATLAPAEIAPHVAEKLSGTKSNQGVFALFETPTPPADTLDTARRILMLEGVQDPGNVGTLLRSAAAFGFDAVVLGPGCASPLSPKTLRSSMGAAGRLPTLRSADLPAALAQQAEKLASEGKTPLFFGGAGRLLGVIAVADTIKEDSPEAIRQLQNMGIRVVMLTGDNQRTADAIGRQAGVDEVIAGVLPDGKEAGIRQLQASGKVAMVGDGINDAPALTRADTGIAIGAGTDVAIDAADVVLMNSKLSDVPAAIRLTRATLRNIHENLFWAFIYNIIGIPLAAGLFIPFGLTLNPMFGAAAMSLSSFFVVSNALRLNLFDLHSTKHDHKIKTSALPAAAQPQAEDTTEPVSESNVKEERSMKKTLHVEGMMCCHCEARVKKALEALPEVHEAVVSHETGTAVVTLSADVANETLKKAVEDQDYKVTGIE